MKLQIYKTADGIIIFIEEDKVLPDFWAGAKFIGCTTIPVL